MLGDTDVLANLRVLQTELTGVGHPRAAAARRGHHRRPGHRTRCGMGGRRDRTCAALRCDSPTTPRCAGWRNGWRCPRAGVSTKRSRGSTGSWPSRAWATSTVRLHVVLPPIASAGTCLSLRVLRPATQDFDALIDCRSDRRRTRRTCSHDIIAARLAFLVSGGTGAGKTTLLSRRAGSRRRRRAHRVRRGRAGTGAAASASGQARRPLRQRRGRRRGDRARPGAAGPADAARTGSSSARCAAARSSTCSRRSTPATTAARARCTPTHRPRCPRDWRRWRRSVGWTVRRCTASWPPRCRSCCTSDAIARVVAGSTRSRCCGGEPTGWWCVDHRLARGSRIRLRHGAFDRFVDGAGPAVTVAALILAMAVVGRAVRAGTRTGSRDERPLQTRKLVVVRRGGVRCRNGIRRSALGDGGGGDRRRDVRRTPSSTTWCARVAATSRPR